MAHTYCANEFNSTPFTSCCQLATFGKTCPGCGEEITHHQHSAAVLAARRLNAQGRCGMCGRPKGPIEINGNCCC